jgi:hypothetical protein
MKATVIRLIIWGVVLGGTQYLYFNSDEYVMGFLFLLGTNILYVVFLQIQLAASLFKKRPPGEPRWKPWLEKLHHLFWTSSVFLALTLFLLYADPYYMWDLTNNLTGMSLRDMIDLFGDPDDVPYGLKSAGNNLLLAVNAGYFLFLLGKLMWLLNRKTPPVPDTGPSPQTPPYKPAGPDNAPPKTVTPESEPPGMKPSGPASPAKAPNFCSECGVPLEAQDRFCPQCGTGVAP